jgi:hypothetical protein
MKETNILLKKALKELNLMYNTGCKNCRENRRKYTELMRIFRREISINEEFEKIWLKLENIDGSYKGDYSNEKP